MPRCPARDLPLSIAASSAPNNRSESRAADSATFAWTAAPKYNAPLLGAKTASPANGLPVLVIPCVSLELTALVICRRGSSSASGWPSRILSSLHLRRRQLAALAARPGAPASSLFAAGASYCPSTPPGHLTSAAQPAGKDEHPQQAGLPDGYFVGAGR